MVVVMIAAAANRETVRTEERYDGRVIIGDKDRGKFENLKMW